MWVECGRGTQPWDLLGTHTLTRTACWVPHFTPRGWSWSQRSCTLPPSLSQHTPLTTSAPAKPPPPTSLLPRAAPGSAPSLPDFRLCDWVTGAHLSTFSPHLAQKAWQPSSSLLCPELALPWTTQIKTASRLLSLSFPLSF